jgi:hypothetical protein
LERKLSHYKHGRVATQILIGIGWLVAVASTLVGALAFSFMPAVRLLFPASAMLFSLCAVAGLLLVVFGSLARAGFDLADAKLGRD